MDFGSKVFDEIAELAMQIHAIASRSYFNPSCDSGAKKAIEAKTNELSELLKTLPE